MKKIIALLLCTALALGICGCSQGEPQNAAETDSSSEIDLGTPQTLTDDNVASEIRCDINENITIDADVSFPGSVSYSSFSADYGRFEDVEQLQSLLMPSYVSADKAFKSVGSEADEELYYYTDKDGAVLTFRVNSPTGNDSILYRRNQEESDYFTMIGGHYAAEYDSLYFAKGEIEGFSADSAVAAAKEVFSAAGVENYIPEPQIFTFNAENFNNYYKNSYEGAALGIGSEIGEFSEEDEAYVLVFTKVFGSVPVNADGWSNDNSHCVEEYNYFVIGRDGIRIYQIYADINVTGSEGENPQLYNTDAVEKQLVSTYQTPVPVNKYLLYGISLEYICTSGAKKNEPMTFELCWYCAVAKTDDMEDLGITAYRDQEGIIINASTGQIFITSGAKKFS